MGSNIGMIEVTKRPISPEFVISNTKTDSSGCVVTYVGLIRSHSHGKTVLSVEYKDANGTAKNELQGIASRIRQKWQVNNVSICHRIGKLKVGDINLVVAVASTHRQEGLAACQYAVDQFKQNLPTQKRETYRDGSILFEGE